jgi:hypothetical protein
MFIQVMVQIKVYGQQITRQILGLESLQLANLHLPLSKEHLILLQNLMIFIMVPKVQQMLSGVSLVQ